MQPCDQVYHWLTEDQGFSLGTPDALIGKTDCYNMTRMLFQVVWNTCNRYTQEIQIHVHNLTNNKELCVGTLAKICSETKDVKL